MDLYTVLGLIKTASSEEIKKAYRKMSLLYHPDRNNGSAESTEKFQSITHAYEILSDDQKRKQYDMFGLDQDNQPSSAGGGFDPTDLFNFFAKNMFGGGGGGGSGMMDPADHPRVFTIHRQGGGGSGQGEGFFAQHMPGMQMPGMQMPGLQNMHKPVPIIKTVEITLSRAYLGCNLPLEITRWVVENGLRREEIEMLYIPITAGIDQNEMIILREKGNILSDHNKGDVKIFIKVENDTAFIRAGLDLHLTKTITLKEALCGLSFDMKYIDGRFFKINNGNGNVISNNYKKVIPDMGMVRDAHKGNLIIEFTVIFPEKLTAEQISALEQIL